MTIKYRDYLKEKKEFVPVALLGLSAFLGVLVLIKVAGFFVTSARAESIVERAVAQNKAVVKEAGKYFAESKKLAEQLKKNNLFAPPATKQNPVSQVEGILGNEAFISGSWRKVGDKIGDARVVAIGPASVKIEWDGSAKEFYPIMSSSSEGQERRPGGPERGTAAAEGDRPGRAEMVVVRSEEGTSSGPAGMGGSGRMRGGMGSMSEQDRERMRSEMQATRERMMNMSPEERDRMREEMRQRFAGGEGGPGRGFGGGFGGGSGDGSGGGSSGGRGSRGGRGQ